MDLLACFNVSGVLLLFPIYVVANPELCCCYPGVILLQFQSYAGEIPQLVAAVHI